MKKELRRQMLQKLSEMNAVKKEWQINNIHQALFETPEWAAAKTIAITVSIKWEIPTELIIEKAWEEGKIVGVPKCDPRTNEMQFRQIKQFGQVKKTYGNLYEPLVDETEMMEKSTIDLMVVPGICFGRNGFRIGYGGGYFDRYLVNFSGRTLSLAYSFQVIPEVPHFPHDIPVEQIVTEKEIIHCPAE
ncbi:5-formyltetrahydrofolate cyclo-ligase [Bacillus gobiensis]|uniref:5-formyltetrahydrofolate cyclo-ligase n=1 Tax=Bacillus gobiensis TaxID=1441095 RepID=UPI003D1CBC42